MLSCPPAARCAVVCFILSLTSGLTAVSMAADSDVPMYSTETGYVHGGQWAEPGGASTRQPYDYPTEEYHGGYWGYDQYAPHGYDAHQDYQHDDSSKQWHQQATSHQEYQGIGNQGYPRDASHQGNGVGNNGYHDASDQGNGRVGNHGYYPDDASDVTSDQGNGRVGNHGYPDDASDQGNGRVGNTGYPDDASDQGNGRVGNHGYYPDDASDQGNGDDPYMAGGPSSSDAKDGHDPDPDPDPEDHMSEVLLAVRASEPRMDAATKQNLLALLRQMPRLSYYDPFLGKTLHYHYADDTHPFPYYSDNPHVLPPSKSLSTINRQLVARHFEHVMFSEPEERRSIESLGRELGMEHYIDPRSPHVRSMNRTVKEHGLCFPHFRRHLTPGDPKLNGGWAWARPPNNAELSLSRKAGGSWPSRCDFDVVHASNMTAALFEEKYRKGRRPVLVRGLNIEDWEGYRRWRKETLMSERSNLTITAGREPPHMKVKMNLKQFVETQIDSATLVDGHEVHPMYMWDFDTVDEDNVPDNVAEHLVNGTVPLRSAFTSVEPFWTQARYPPMLTPKSWIRESFAFLLGPACSATHFHAHAAAYNVLLYGLKRWVTYTHGVGRPAVERLELLHFLDWLHQGYPELYGKDPGFQECYQYPGDMIYVPGGVEHGVLNVHTSVAIASQELERERQLQLVEAARVNRSRPKG